MSEGAPLPSQEFEPLPPDEAGELEALATTSFLGSLQQFISTVPDRITHQLTHKKAKVVVGTIFNGLKERPGALWRTFTTKDGLEQAWYGKSTEDTLDRLLIITSLIFVPALNAARELQKPPVDYTAVTRDTLLLALAVFIIGNQIAHADRSAGNPPTG